MSDLRRFDGRKGAEVRLDFSAGRSFGRCTGIIKHYATDAEPMETRRPLQRPLSPPVPTSSDANERVKGVTCRLSTDYYDYY